MVKECEVCSTSFWARERKGRSEPYARFCSKECYWKWRKDKQFSTEGLFKRGFTPWNKGKAGLLSEESILKMSLSRKGKTSPMKGKKHTKEALKKMSESRIGKYRGEDSSLWKGEAVQYRGLHIWVEKELGKPKKCEHCPKDNLSGHSIHWSNISGNYRRDLSDWQRLCVRCHKKFDGYKVKS